MENQVQRQTVAAAAAPSKKAELGRTSVMKVASLKPEVEFEVIKLVLLRENYIKKLEKTLTATAGMIDISVLGLIEIFRDCTIETVDTIRMWERTQVDFPKVVQPFIWNKQNYLQKIVDDILFLGDYPELTKWLGFNPALSPLLVPFEILSNDFNIDTRSFVTFGKRPPVVVVEKKVKKVKYIKSPYETPIVNDADVIPSLNIVNKVMAQEKDKKKKLLLESNSKDKATDPATDPYETFISFDQLKKLKFCWKVLFDISPKLKSQYETFISESSQEMVPSIISEEKSFADSYQSNETPASFKESQDDFFASLENTVNPKNPPNLNKRMTPVGTRGANIWTPHDIVLQRSVQKKGGELSVLTASGTQGRMIAPWRKSRFERLEIDLEHTTEMMERIQMEINCIDSRNSEINSDCKSRVLRTEVSVKEILAIEYDYKTMIELRDKVKIHYKLLRYQLDHFKKLSAGGALGSLDHNKKWRNLEDATPLEADEKLSMKLEDYCARKIQARIYIKFGRVMRQGLIRARNKAAVKIQTRYRYHRTSSLTLDLSAKIRVAISIQKRWRGRIGLKERKRLERLMAETFATRLLQRVYRGHHGRKRFKLKLEFSRRIKAGAEEVDPMVFQPGHVDEIADVIEVYLRDFFYQLTPAVLTVIRAIFFMLNGDAPEVVMIENCGYVENKLIFAESMTWYSARLLLRRKGRFIRRVRDLSRTVNIPNPARLKFNENCRMHLDCLNDLTEADFDQVKHARFGILKLFRFAFHMMRIQKLQDMFPEYFDATQPAWFYTVSTLKNTYELHRLNFMTESRCLQKINENKERTIKEGKSIGPVTRATRIILASLKITEKKLSTSKVKLDSYLKQLREDELKRIDVNENLERARFLGADIAVRDLKEYMNNNPRNPNKETLRDLRNNIDKKEMDLLDTRANIEMLKNTMIADQKWRNFDAILKMSKLEDMSTHLGICMGDLLVLNEIWKDFLTEVGGMQFVFDLVGEKQVFFEKVRVMSLALMKQRRDLMKRISKSLKDQFKRIKRLALEEKRRILNEPRDTNTDVQKRSETNENRECARRDADAVESAKSRPDFVSIKPSYRTPLIILVDKRLPMSTIAHIVRNLERINFRAVKSNQADVPSLLREMQDIIDDKHDIIYIADRGMHFAARAEFEGILANLMCGLIPNPKLVAIDGSLSLRFEDWHSSFKTAFPDPNTFVVKDSEQCTLSLGKLRRIGLIFEKCLLEKDPLLADVKDTFEVPLFIKNRFKDDFASLINDICGYGDGNDSMSHVSSLENGGMVLAATVASVLELWKAPTMKWRERQIGIGCEHFLDLSSNPELFCRRLFLDPLPKCTKLMKAQMECAWSMRKAWDAYMQCSLIDYPARYLMAQWCIEAIRLINSCVEYGGIAGNQFKTQVECVYDVRWKEDIANNPDNMIGKVLSAAFKEYLIYESTNSEVTYYFNKKTFRKAEQKIIGEKTFIQNVKVYHRGEFCYVSCDFKRDNDLEPITYFQFMKLSDIVSMLSPNGIEIFEGRVTQYDISDGGRHKWYELVSNWSRLNDVGQYFQVSLLRARHLMLSRIGFVSGFSSRYEIYEETLGEILILIHGINPKGAIEYRVDRKNMANLLAVCDELDEKPQIEAMDTPAIASIYADRLEVSPPRVWQDWLADGELEPKNISRTTRGKLRLNRGPGRFIGRQLVKICGMSSIISLYELTNDTDLHTLRICIYEIKLSQTVEFRISPMERMSLFNSDAPIIGQIIDRMKVVYCDLDDPNRTLIKLPKNFVPDRYDYKIDGSAEYDILPLSIHMQEIIKVKKEKVVYDPNEIVEGDDEDEPESSDDEKVPKFQGVTVKKELCRWGWAVYFNRNVVTKHRGNLTISFGLNTSMRGFLVTIFDNRKLLEAFRFISFEDCLRIMKSYETVFKIEEQLRTLDESSVLELVDEFEQGFEIVPIPGSLGHFLVQFKVMYQGDLYKTDGSGDMVDKKSIQIAILKEHNISETESVREKHKRKVIQPRKIKIEVLKLRDLSLNAAMAPRSPFCILRFNMREIGRTPVMPICKKPDFKENNVFEVESNLNQLLQFCVFELEVFDTNYLGEEEDFLGSVKLNGEEGMKFLLTKDPVWYKLNPSNKYTDADNRFVSGKVEIRTDITGDLSDAKEFFPHLMHLRKSKVSFMPTFDLKLGGGEAVGKALSNIGAAIGNLFKNPFGKSKAEKEAEEIAKKIEEERKAAEESRGRSRTPKKKVVKKEKKEKKRKKSKSPTKALGNLFKGVSLFGGKKDDPKAKPESSSDDSEGEEEEQEVEEEEEEEESEDEGFVDSEANRAQAEERAVMFYVNKKSNCEYIAGEPFNPNIETTNAYSHLSKMEQRRLPELDVDFASDENIDQISLKYDVIENVRSNYLQLVKFGELNLAKSKRLEIYLSTGEDWPAYIQEGVIVIMRWNDAVVYRSPLFDDIDTETGSIWFRDEYVSIEVPDEYISSHSFEISIWDRFERINYAILDLSGYRLSWLAQDRGSFTTTFPINFIHEDSLFDVKVKKVIQSEDDYKEHLKLLESLKPAEVKPAFATSGGKDLTPSRTSLNKTFGSRNSTPDAAARRQSRQSTPDQIKSRMRSGSKASVDVLDLRSGGRDDGEGEEGLGDTDKPSAGGGNSRKTTPSNSRSNSRNTTPLRVRGGAKTAPLGDGFGDLGMIEETVTTSDSPSKPQIANTKSLTITNMIVEGELNMNNMNYNTEIDDSATQSYYSACPSRMEIKASLVDLNTPVVERFIDFSLLSYKNMLDTNKALAPAKIFVKVYMNNKFVKEVALKKSDNQTYPYPLYGTSEKLRVPIRGEREISDCKLDFYIIEKEVLGGGTCYGFRRFDGDDLLGLLDYDNILKKFTENHEEKLEEQKKKQEELDILNDPMGLGLGLGSGTSRPLTAFDDTSPSRPQSSAYAAGGVEVPAAFESSENFPSRPQTGARSSSRGGVTIIPLEDFESRPTTVNNPSESIPQHLNFPSRPTTTAKDFSLVTKGFFNVGNIAYMRSQGWGTRLDLDEKGVMRDELSNMFSNKSRPGTSQTANLNDRPPTAKPNADPNFKPKPVTYELSEGMEPIKGMKARGFSNKLIEAKVKENGLKYTTPKGNLDIACAFANPFLPEDTAIDENIAEMKRKIVEKSQPPPDESADPSKNSAVSTKKTTNLTPQLPGRPANAALNSLNALNKSRAPTPQKDGNKPKTPNQEAKEKEAFVAEATAAAADDKKEEKEDAVLEEYKPPPDPWAEFRNTSILHSLVQNLPATVLHFEIFSIQNFAKNGSDLNKGHFMFEVMVNGISKHKSGPYSLVPDVFHFGGPVEVVLPKGLRIESCEVSVLIFELQDDSSASSAQYVGGRTFKDDDLLAIAGCIDYDKVSNYNISPDISVYASENYNYGKPIGHLCGLSFDNKMASSSLIKPTFSGSIVTKVRLNYNLDETLYIDSRLFNVNYRKFTYIHYFVDLSLVSLKGHTSKIVTAPAVADSKSKKEKDSKSKKEEIKKGQDDKAEGDKELVKDVKAVKHFVDVIVNGQLSFRSNLIELKTDPKNDNTSLQEKFRLYFPTFFPTSSTSIQFVLWKVADLGDGVKDIVFSGSFDVESETLVEVERVLSSVNLSAKSLSDIGLKSDLTSSSTFDLSLKIANQSKRSPGVKVDAKAFNENISLSISMQPGVSIDFTKKRHRNTSNNYRLQMARGYNPPVLISTNLAENDEKPWRCDFGDGKQREIAEEPSTLLELTAANLVRQPGLSFIKTPNNPGTGATSAHSAFKDKSNDATNDATKEFIKDQTEKKVVGSAIEELKVKIRNVPKVELPAMSYIFKEKSTIEEDRICWRGRSMPRNFKANLETKKAILMSRSSRVIKTKKIGDAQVVAEVTYIKESTDVAASEGGGDTDGKLPICAKEIVSEGPGLVKRLYRIELSANNGQKMGHADILDTFDDFKDCLGPGGVHLIKDIPRSSWVLGDIFAFIVEERCILEILTASKQENNSKKKNDKKNMNSSVYLIRDSVLLMEVEERKKASVTHAIGNFFSKIGNIFGNRDKAEKMAAEAAEAAHKEARQAYIAALPPRKYWIRVFKTNKNLCGNRFRMTVLFESLLPDIEQNTKDYIASFESAWHLLKIVDVTIRLKECAKRVVSIFPLTGVEVINWISKDFPLDFTTKFRRAKFGEYLCNNITMQYDVKGDSKFVLNEELKKSMAKEDPKAMQIPKELLAQVEKELADRQNRQFVEGGIITDKKIPASASNDGVSIAPASCNGDGNKIEVDASDSFVGDNTNTNTNGTNTNMNTNSNEVNITDNTENTANVEVEKAANTYPEHVIGIDTMAKNDATESSIIVNSTGHTDNASGLPSNNNSNYDDGVNNPSTGN